MEKDVEKVILKDRRKKMRIRSILRHLQALSINNGQLRLVILEEIIYYLRKNNIPYSKREVYSAFHYLPKEEYLDWDKNNIIHRLCKGGESESVFTKKYPPTRPRLRPQGAFWVQRINYTPLISKATLNCAYMSK